MRIRPICRARLLFWSGLFVLSAISLGCARNVERVPSPREQPAHAQSEATDEVASADDKTKATHGVPGLRPGEEPRREADAERDDRARNPGATNQPANAVRDSQIALPARDAAPKSPPSSPDARPRPDPTSRQPLREAKEQEKNEAGRRLNRADDHPLAGQGGGVGGDKDAENIEKDKKKSNKGPTTWNRDAKRPTFARVYVGDRNSLELVSLQVTVTVDGPRARTVVDHIFRNPHDRQLEGTFEYPLPTGASPSYFAMFLGQTRDTVPVRFGPRGQEPPLPQEKLAHLPPDQLVRQVSTADWGTLREARVVNKEKALETYEEVVRGRIDPALLEYAGGNTFSGRVFPIPPKGYNRVLIAYEELLPVSQDKVLYHFPLPDCKLSEIQFNLYANSDQCKNVTFKPEDAKKEEGGSQLAFNKTWTEKGPGGEVLFSHTPANPAIQAITARSSNNGPLYVYARIRPEMKVQAAKPFAEQAIFLLDTSLSEHPDRFAVSMKLLKKILESDPAIKQFNVLAFNVAAAWVEPKGWIPNTPEGRDDVFKRLDGVVLEGATDLSAALDKAAKPGFDLVKPTEVFLLSDGQVTWGESDVAQVVARFEGRCSVPTRFHCYRTGIGADNLELFEALTRRGGGIFNVYTEADLPAAAVAHRQQCMQVDRVRFVGGPASSDVLIAGRKGAVYPGGELIVGARLAAPGRTSLIVEGTFMGEKVAEEYPIEATGSGELAARGWGEIAVSSLLALNDPKFDGLVTAYCQQFGIGSKVASFLVLENVNDYKRLNLEEERGKTLNGDLGTFLDDLWKSMGKVASAREVFLRFLAKVDPRVKLMSGPDGAHVKKMLEVLKDADFEMPEAPLAGKLLVKADVRPQYLAARDADRRNVEVYLSEAEYRLKNAKDADGAVRMLSSIIEEYPARGDALRLVGYRLMDLQQPAHAVRLFDRVQRSRPFEPHSYLDLARSLEQAGKYGLAAVNYEIALAGTWHPRFHASLKDVAREDYGRMMRQAIRDKKVGDALADHFGERLEKMDPSKLQSDFRVSMSWNTDATDIDLWVIEPDGTKVFYSAPKSKNGGELSQDMTQGFGPERYQMKKAVPGEYKVIVHYYGANPNLLGGETHVSVNVTRFAGTAQEVTERYTVILKKQNQEVEVCRVKY
jgi:tetratricopeptide (TPR) repeat protein